MILITIVTFLVSLQVTPLLHCTKQHKSDGDKPKGCSILIKSCLITFFLSLIHCFQELEQIPETKVSADFIWRSSKFLNYTWKKKKILCDLSVPVTSKQKIQRKCQEDLFALKDKNSHWSAPFLPIGVLRNNANVFCDRGLNELSHRKRQCSSSSLPEFLPSAVSAQALVPDKLDPGTDQLEMCFFSYWGFFFNDIISQVAGRSTERLFFFPCSKPNSPNFSGISTHADAGAEQHWALEEKN